MKRVHWATALLLTTALSGQEMEDPLPAEHAECSYFNAAGMKLRADRSNAARVGRWSQETAAVAALLSRSAGPSRAAEGSSENLVDRNIFGVLRQRGITPAARANDYEFLRRVSLDLTGRVPTVAQLTAFVADTDPAKRAKAIDSLLDTPEWVDKWTMFFGDLYRNTDIVRATNTNRFADGREAFYRWIKESLAANRPYSEMASSLIAAQGQNSFERGELNWQVGNRVTNGPAQDMYDQMAAATAETFLGVSHFNCILCHNGRGHVDTLSLWGRGASRMQAYGFAAYFSQTTLATVRPVPAVNYFSWNVNFNTRGSYTLGTTTGNRPARTQLGPSRTVAPEYPFSAENAVPVTAGENWRATAARNVVNDPLFARATVNYLWRELMVRGLVEPANQLDPARLDPDNPPPDPWTLQPTNARLLKELGEFFAANNFDLKAVMRLIANSDAYQLSARYEGEWNPSWESLHARRLVRRLSAEELHDAIAQTSNVPVNITFGINSSDRTQTRTVNWAMQTPAPTARGGSATFLDAFYPGDREDNERRRDGSDQQALALMNNAFVMNRTRATGTGPTASLLRQVLNLDERQMVDTLFLTVLSRYPDESERAAAVSALSNGNRSQQAENFLWALYNKVDFTFNY
jgi:hypothetical protein